MKVVAFTGAGISKSAGIPTFEEIPNLKEKLSVEYRDEHPKEFYEAMDMLINSVKDKEPTVAHYALASLPIPIITMNVDRLHSKAGSREVYEIHGNYRDENIVLYGQNILHIESVINLIIQTAQKAKLDDDVAVLLVIGTSMQTAFSHSLVNIAEKCGFKVVYINDNADIEVPKFINEQVFLYS